MKLFILTKNKLIYSCLLLILVSALLSINYDYATTVINNVSEQDEDPISSVKRDDNKLSITFDVIEGNENIKMLIDILNKYQIKATFFVVGNWADQHSDSVKQLSDAGQEVMNYSNSYTKLSKLSTEELKQEILTCGDKIALITGKKPNLLRLPYGDYNDFVLKTSREVGYQTIRWNIDSTDSKSLSVNNIIKTVDNEISPGSIILFHISSKNTPQALPKIIEMIKNKNMEIVPVSELIYQDNYSVDSNGRQISNDIPSNSLD